MLKNEVFGRSGGAFVDQLETNLAQYVNRKHCITCASGTDALLLAFMACGVKEGDAVFCPDMTFFASIEPACSLGAIPYFCDINPETYNISPSSLDKKIQEVLTQSQHTPKVVIAVDFLGNPADFKQIESICQKYDLILIEDAAQAMGGKYHDKKCGSFGKIACTSFFPSKPLGCYGDGGAVFTDDDEIANVIRSLKNHGKGTSKYDNVRIGINSRLDNMQAGILLPKLDILEKEMEFRSDVAQRYDKALGSKYKVPYIPLENRSAYAQYCILTHDSSNRDCTVEKLKKEGIPSLIYYPNPLHQLKVFPQYNKDIVVNATQYAKCNLGIPFSPYLCEADQNRVIDILLSIG